jgi:8-oxo-dGTP diphosphatase
VPEPQFARMRVAAGVVFVDERGWVLMVVPSYKAYFDIPGGFVEPGESPRAAAQREVREELGIEPPIGRLLVVDWAPTPEDGDKLIFLFDGGELTEADREAITLDGDEILAYELRPVDTLAEVTIPRFVRRITHAVEARQTGETRYIETRD